MVYHVVPKHRMQVFMINGLNLTVSLSFSAGDELSTTTGAMINDVSLTAKHPAQQGAIPQTPGVDH